jgi:hypothetical protein
MHRAGHVRQLGSETKHPEGTELGIFGAAAQRHAQLRGRGCPMVQRIQGEVGKMRSRRRGRAEVKKEIEILKGTFVQTANEVKGHGGFNEDHDDLFWRKWRHCDASNQP